MRHAPAVPVVFAAAVFLLVACDQAINPVLASLGGSTTTTSDTTTIALVVTPSSAQLTVAQTAQLATNASDSLLPITWTSSNPAVATVSSGGLVTAIGAGTATVTARSSVDTNATGTALISVSG